MDIQVRFPGRLSDDPRETVTLREPGTPWPITFHFLRLLEVAEDGTKTTELVNVGFEVGEHFKVEPGVRGPLPIEVDPEPIDFVALQRITNNYAAYMQLARQALTLRDEGMAGAIKLLRGPGQKPARLNDDFYRLIAADYQARKDAGEQHLVKAIAAAHHVTASAASRWIKEARRRGHITENGGENDAS